MGDEEDATTGSVVLRIPGWWRGRPVRAPAADLVVLVLEGAVDVTVGGDPPRRLGAGEAAACPRGQPWRLDPDGAGARVLVVGHPAGPEGLVRALVHGALDDATLVAVARDAGVELLLDDGTPRHLWRGGPDRARTVPEAW